MYKPILFNTDMVCSILDERKSTTRRIAKGVYPYSEYGGFATRIKGELTGPVSEENIIKLKAPYQLGDILYVRETWAFQCCIDCMNIYEDDSCMIGKTSTIHEDKDSVSEGCYIYKAGHAQPNRITWRPSIYMPKTAARIWLKVTDVRVEWLHDMTLDDFLSEGVVIRPEAFNGPENAYMQAKSEFTRIWDSTIKKSDRALYSWDANPFVFVTEFERKEK